MSIVYDRVMQVIEKTKVTPYAIEKGVGLSKGVIKKWENAPKVPEGETILKVANFLDVSTDYLLGNTQNPKSHKNNLEDCTIAVQRISDVVQKYTETTITANHNLSDEIQKILETYHIDL